MTAPTDGRPVLARRDEYTDPHVLEAVDRLRAWSDGHLSVNGERAYASCVTVAIAGPSLDVEALVVATKVVLWTFAVDDAVDEGLVEADDVGPLFDGLGAIATGGHAADDAMPDDPVSRSLREITADVHRHVSDFPLFDLLRAPWEEAVARFLAGVRQEDEWRRAHQETGALPDLETYLANGSWSSGVPPVFWAIGATIGDATLVDHADELSRQIVQTGRTCRLANDLRSYRKEIDEGSLNAVMLLAAEADADAPPQAAVNRARERVSAELASSLRRCKQSTPVRTHTGLAERGLLAFTEWICAFYERTGFLSFQPGLEHVDHGWTSDQS